MNYVKDQVIPIGVPFMLNGQEHIVAYYETDNDYAVILRPGRAGDCKFSSPDVRKWYLKGMSMPPDKVMGVEYTCWDGDDESEWRKAIDAFIPYEDPVFCTELVKRADELDLIEPDFSVYG